MGSGEPDPAVGGPADEALPPSLPHRVALQTVPTGDRVPLWRQVAGEVRWSLTPPWVWFSGVFVNLVLSFCWLLVQPLTGGPHRDWAIVVGTYFAIFILADVTTTNVLGADPVRVRLAMLRGVSFWRVLLAKNLTLFIIVGLPTLVATAIITVQGEPGYRLELTLPGVLYPFFTWVGVGNLISVLLPVAAIPILERWRRRRQLRPTVRWLFHLAVPYALLLVVQPMSRLPRLLTGALRLPGTIAVRGAVIALTGLVLYLVGSAAALLVARKRGVRIR
jgi:hypothetical protein